LPFFPREKSEQRNSAAGEAGLTNWIIVHFLRNDTDFLRNMVNVRTDSKERRSNSRRSRAVLQKNSIRFWRQYFRLIVVFRVELLRLAAIRTV
jgi:hypothetical protein